MKQSAAPSFAVASWNIHKGVGGDRRRDLGRIAAVIAELDADIIALQEADLRWGDRAGLLDLDRLHHETGLSVLPLGLDGPSHGWHGNVVLLRGAMVGRVTPLSLPGLEPRGAVIADFTLQGQNLRLVAAHFGLLGANRRAQGRAIVAALQDLPDRPTLMMGDLNEWRRAGSLEPLLAHFDAPATTPRSFPAGRPLLALDRIMVRGATLAPVAVHATALARQASDHLPIRSRLTVAAQAVAGQVLAGQALAARAAMGRA